ncbi:MAG: hypothetical protein ACREDV_12865 [Methylocella sp.]
MTLRKLGAAASCLCMMVLPVPLQARPLGTVEGMPFFGHPYPYGYVYHPPNMECYAFSQSYDPLYGPRIDVIWTCGSPVTAKY